MDIAQQTCVFFAIELQLRSDYISHMDGWTTYRVRIEKTSNHRLPWDEYGHRLSKHIADDTQEDG